MKSKTKIGLALSGGGYRAATYHIGTIRALKKLDLLDRINVISTNSGGSITGACYSLYHNSYDEFENAVLNGVQQSVVGRVIKHPRFLIPFSIFLALTVISLILLFSSYAWINIIIWPSIILAIGFAQFEILPISRIIERIYDKLFFRNRTLSDFSPEFQITINSTNLETGRIFHFSRGKMGDSKYQYRDNLESITFNPKSFPVSKAVMASSCVPFAFTPVKISKEYFINPLHSNEVSPRLVDGGVYDNQGIHKLTFPKSSSYCDNVIISDAGTELPFKNSYKNVIALLIRTSNVFMNRIKNFQMMDNLYRIPTEQDSMVAYQSLGFNLENSIEEFMNMLKSGYLSAEVIKAHKIPTDWIESRKWVEIEELVSKNVNLQLILNKGCSKEELNTARLVGTNLIPLKKKQTLALIKHSETITELQVRLFLPHLID